MFEPIFLTFNGKNKITWTELIEKCKHNQLEKYVGGSICSSLSERFDQNNTSIPKIANGMVGMEISNFPIDPVEEEKYKQEIKSAIKECCFIASNDGEAMLLFHMKNFERNYNIPTDTYGDYREHRDREWEYYKRKIEMAIYKDHPRDADKDKLLGFAYGNLPETRIFVIDDKNVMHREIVKDQINPNNFVWGDWNR